MKSKNRFIVAIFLIIVFTQQSVLYCQNEKVVPKHAQALADLENYYTFMIASDLGQNGYFDQKAVAEMMGEVADITDPEFVAALGDVHHFMGVRSVQDPLWETNFEWIYKHPELMIPWHPVLGNHEYQGTAQAVLDYSGISRRWQMPGRYYAKTWLISENVEVLLLFIDTAPLIDKYHNDPVGYKDAGQQSIEQQLAWINSTLGSSKARWKLVMGHHPVYTGTTKSESERLDLQKRLQPLLDKHGVDAYICGHIHNFQHLRVPNSKVDYFVNSSASKAREVVRFEGAQFGSPDPGFSLCTTKETELIITFVNIEGQIIYQYTRKK